MSEKFTLQGESAEQMYIIDRESGYFKALAFATDPVAYFANHRTELIAQGHENKNICQQAIADMGELEDILGNNDMQVADSRVHALRTAEHGSEEWIQLTFGILKDAGFTKDEALAWAILDDEESTAEEKLQERTARYFIQALYTE
ncbi:MAG: hypothetical protein V4606_04765 [Patescibacteria group bacterium]